MTKLIGTEDLDGTTLIQTAKETDLTKGTLLAITSDRFKTPVEGEEIDLMKVSSCEKSDYPKYIHNHLFGEENTDLDVVTLKRQKFVIADVRKPLNTLFVFDTDSAVSSTDIRLSKNQIVYVEGNFYKVTNVEKNKSKNNDDNSTVEFIVTGELVQCEQANAVIRKNNSREYFTNYNQFLGNENK